MENFTTHRHVVSEEVEWLECLNLKNTSLDCLETHLVVTKRVEEPLSA
jgi:hypothetical protein